MNFLLKKSWPFRIHISTLMIFVLLFSCVGLSVFIYDANVKLVEKHTDKLLKYVIKQVTDEVEQLMESPEAVTRIISSQTSPDSLAYANTFEQRMQTLPFFTEILSHTEHFLSIYAGYKNGDFFQIKKYTQDMTADLDENVKRSVRWVVRSIDSNDKQQHQITTIYLDSNLNRLTSITQPSQYDPRERPWYQSALKSPVIQRSDILMFASDHNLGFIISRRAQLTSPISSSSPNSVIGTSIYLRTLSDTIKKQRITPNSEIIIFDENGGLVAYKDINKIILKDKQSFRQGHLSDLKMYDFNAVFNNWQTKTYNSDLTFDFTTQEQTWRATLLKLNIHPGSPLFIIIAIPHNELFHQVILIRNKALTITIIFILILLPLTLYLANRISRPLKQLSEETESIKSFNFSEHKIPTCNISEIDHLNHSMSDMKATIRRFLDINMIVASEDNFDRLLPRLLNETLSVSKAESIALYLVDQNNQLTLAEVQNKDGNIEWNKEKSKSQQCPDIIMEAVDVKSAQVTRFTAQKLVQDGLGIMFDNHSETHQDIQYNVVAIPLFNRKHELVGVMLLITLNRIEASLLEFLTAICSSSAITLETKSLIQAQKDLFEAFVKLIAGAIDAKSPYTGGHCERVPVLTKALAQAANDCREGVFKDFTIPESDWEAIHIAAWLHDCGKVTTPEFIVDKSTKLETIYDRIHEVRMRFEVLYRDAQLRYWQALSQSSQSESERTRLQQQLEQELEQLQQDFAFIAHCNQGSEFLSDADKERLKTLAQTTWQRFFSDRLGISEEEKRRKSIIPEPTLPTEETLLLDKPEHLFARPDMEFTHEDNPWGFKMNIPKLLYNRGELYNLCVEKGTLSEEERFKINEHIVQTIIMLSQLPFPKHLKQITEIAGSHHEKVDGSGYPRGLTVKQMSPVARMMAIADIFEALTAVDRPYKKGKTLSEAIRIMSFMVRDKHIDADVFKLFLSAGVYRQYAEKYLKPEQIDEVDITQYL